MDVGKIKRWALYGASGALGCVLAWKIVQLSSPGVPERPVVQGPPPGSVPVTVNMIGFDPPVVETRAGQPVRLAFFRTSSIQCTREVVFPSLGIRRDLPTGRFEVIEITPSKNGSIHFECGMSMLKGQLLVR